MMLKLCFQLLFVLFTLARDKRPPALKPGRTAHSSKVTRSHSNGKTLIGVSLSSTDNIELELEPTELLTADYEEIEVGPDGSHIVHRRGKDMHVCWFKGHIVGDPSSRVLATDCDGFEALITLGDGRNFVAKSQGEGQDDVAVYDTEDEEETHHACANEEHNHSHDHDHEAAVPPQRRLFGAPFQPRKLLTTDSTKNVIEIIIVSDKLYLDARGGPFGRDLSAIGQRNIQIMNIVKAAYENTVFEKKTTFLIKKQAFFNHGDPYTMTLDANGEIVTQTLLDSFTTWVQANLPTVDLVHLFSYYDFQGVNAGLAATPGACAVKNCGVSMVSSSLISSAAIVAHEIGHNLGMLHDGVSPNAGCPGTGFVMAPLATCPASGQCVFSPCSIANKDAFARTASAECLQTWTDPTCSDGVMNGNEEGVDCGGSCSACTSLGCVNNDCQDQCTPTGALSYTCSCSDQSKYLDPVDGKSCISDINQCDQNPCAETCQNKIGPGDSFECSCAPPKYLSLVDGRSCIQESCSDGILNQNEVLIDCGGVCSACVCLVATSNYVDPSGVALDKSKWISKAGSAFARVGTPARYIYADGGGWLYDTDTANNGYLGLSPPFAGDIPYSGQWQMYDGVSGFAAKSLSFALCSSVSATCGNAVIEASESCDTCLEISQFSGVCVKPNPCCRSCNAPHLRGTACVVDGLAGACWDGVCQTRSKTCKSFDPTYSGGENCGFLKEKNPFSSSSCGNPFQCWKSDCSVVLFSGVPLQGFPCSALVNPGKYTSTCNGVSTTCEAIPGSTGLPSASPTRQQTVPTKAPTSTPTTAPTATPTRSPTIAPTREPASFPTNIPTATPTLAPTATPTRDPTNAPTTTPTREPSLPTKAPTSSPTYSTTVSPTSAPTVEGETRSPTTETPTRGSPSAPTRFPTNFPSNFPTLPTLAPTVSPTTVEPTKAPTLKPTTAPGPPSRPTRSPTRRPTRRPTTGKPTKKPTNEPTAPTPRTQRPTKVPTLKPTRRPSREPTHRPTRRPTPAPTRRPTRSPTERPTRRPSREPTFRPTRRPNTPRPTRPTIVVV